MRSHSIHGAGQKEEAMAMLEKKSRIAAIGPVHLLRSLSLMNFVATSLQGAAKADESTGITSPYALMILNWTAELVD